jgi:hypothetical protein
VRIPDAFIGFQRQLYDRVSNIWPQAMGMQILTRLPSPARLPNLVEPALANFEQQSAEYREFDWCVDFLEFSIEFL